MSNEVNNDLLGGIFGQSVADIATTIESETNEGGGYTPHLELDPQGNKDNKDFAIVRLIRTLVPNAKNIVEKKTYKVNVEGGNNFFYDSKKSLGWNDNVCEIVDTYNAVKEDAAKLARFKSVFNFRKPKTVLVQVLEYKTKPELVGRILPLRIQDEVEKIISGAISPSEEDVKYNGAVPNNVFDPLTGNVLMLKAGLKKIGTDKKTGKDRIGRTFDESKFLPKSELNYFMLPKTDDEGNKITKMVGEGDKQVEVFEYDNISLEDSEIEAYSKKDFSNSDLKSKLVKVLQYLQEEDTPKVEDYGYREPSEDRTKTVLSYTKAILSGEPLPSASSSTTSTSETDSETKSDDVVDNSTTTEDTTDELQNILAAANAG